MNFGLTPSDFALLQQLVIEPIKRLGAQVYIFGSRSTGEHHKFSDIDLLIETDDYNAVSAAVIKARDEIEESDFPIKADIVMMSELAQSYRPTVISQRIKL